MAVGGRRMLSRALEAVLRVRGAAYDSGLLSERRVLGARVVSVGGLSVGGDGKTPLAMHLAERLLELGASPAFVARGYRGLWERRGGIVSDGRRVLATSAEAGDEAFLAARRLPAVPVVVGADRVLAARRAVGLGARVVVLDSGMQHRRLARDLEIVALDARAPGWKDLFPLGRLREPLDVLSRVDLVAVQAGGPSPPRRGFGFELVPEALVELDLTRVGCPSWLEGRAVLAVAGIARPSRLAASLRLLGARVVGAVERPDHHRFRPNEVAGLEDEARRLGAELIVTTEKDAVRMPRPASVRALALRVAVRIETGESTLRQALGRIAEGAAR